MKSSAGCSLAPKSTFPHPNGINTNLYDLIEAMGDEIRVGEEMLIAQTILHMIKTGRMRFIGNSILIA